MPWMKRHAISCGSVVAVAASNVTTAKANADATMVVRRPIRYESFPTEGADSATASVGAVTVRLTWKLLA